MNYQKMANGLGWFSVGIGVTELLAAGPLARTLGMGGHNQLLRGFGVREIATGVGILTQPRRGPWLWARVGGDLIDLATLGRAMARARAKKGPLLAVAAVAGITALDILCGKQLATHAS